MCWMRISKPRAGFVSGHAHHDGEEYPLYYHAAPGERDDGVTLGVHVDQLPELPTWLPGWGVDGNLRERAEILLRSLPKDYRRVCQPIAPVADGFAELWCHAPKDMPLFQALSEHVKERNGARRSRRRISISATSARSRDENLGLR